LSFTRYFLHREPLARKVMYPTKQHERDIVAFSFDNIEDVFLPQREFTGPRRYFKDGIGRVEPVQSGLGVESILRRNKQGDVK
jgi:hypothetical protein